MKIEISIHQEALSVMLCELSMASHALCLHKQLTHLLLCTLPMPGPPGLLSCLSRKNTHILGDEMTDDGSIFTDFFEDVLAVKTNICKSSVL